MTQPVLHYPHTVGCLTPPCIFTKPFLQGAFLGSFMKCALGTENCKVYESSGGCEALCLFKYDYSKIRPLFDEEIARGRKPIYPKSIDSDRVYDSEEGELIK